MSETEPDPPEAPAIEHRLRFHPWQWIGIPILFLIPILAAVGLFGTAYTSVSPQTADVSVQLSHPTRQRYKMLGSMDFDVTNRSGSPLARVEISVDTAYLARFSTVMSVPPFSEPYLIELIDLGPGETRRATIEIQAEDYGRHRGEVRIGTPGDTARVDVSTFVFP